MASENHGTVLIGYSAEEYSLAAKAERDVSG
jgi:hypothetical protein